MEDIDFIYNLENWGDKIKFEKLNYSIGNIIYVTYKGWGCLELNGCFG